MYKGYAERAGFAYTSVEMRTQADVVRSCERGLGAPVKAMALPFQRLHLLPGGHSPWVKNGPLGPRNMIVAGSWFLLREIEVSLARANAVYVDSRSSPPSVSWSLPVSKTDPRATGTSRVHGCSCPSSKPTPSCPVHAIWDQLLLLRRRVPHRFAEHEGEWKPDEDLPLFPSESEGVVTKEAVVDTILAAGKHLQIPLVSADGAERL